MPCVIRRGALALGVGLLVAWPGAALAQSTDVPTVSDQVVLSGDVHVPRGTVVGEVVVFAGSATVEGVVQGDVVVVDGPVTIGGQVGGDVVALHGPIRLLATAQVTGDVLAGGNLIMVDGAQVTGTVRRDVGFTLAGPAAALGALLVSAAMSVSILLVGLVILLLAPRGAERSADAARSAPASSAGWGLLLAFGVPIVAVAAAATIVGLPLGLVVALGLGLLVMVGQAMVTFIVGRLLVHAPRSRIGALFAGWGIGTAVGLVPFLNVAWWTLGSVFGLGAMLVAAWRARSGPSAALVPGGRGGRHRARRAPRPAPVPAGATPGPSEPSTERPVDMPLAED